MPIDRSKLYPHQRDILDAIESGDKKFLQVPREPGRVSIRNVDLGAMEQRLLAIPGVADAIKRRDRAAVDQAVAEHFRNKDPK